MNDQLILKFPSKKIFLKEDFYVSASNQEAYEFINSWPRWIKRIVNIFGEKGSGKSHLASFLKNKTSTIEIQSDNKAIVNLSKPESSVSPGQACVFYSKDEYGTRL